MSRNKLVPKLRFKGFEEGWRSIEIKDVADVVGGGTPSTEVDEYWNGDIDWYTPSEVGKTKFIKSSEKTITIKGLNNSSAKLLPKNTILLSSRATIGETSILTKDSATNQGFQSLIVNSDNDVEFIYYLIGTIKKELFRKASGSTFLEINSKEIKKLNIKVPKIDEQEKIASFLSVVDKKLNLLNDKLVQIQYFKNFLLRNIFSQKIRFKEFKKEWRSYKLGDIVELMRNGTSQTQLNFETSFPVTRIETISKGVINYNRVGYVEEIDEGYRLLNGDILLSNINSIKYIGNLVYFDDDKTLYHGMNLMLMRFKEDFNKKFLYYFMKYHQQWFQMMACQAVNQASINQTSLKKFPFLIPNDIKEQNKIVNILDLSSMKIDLIENQISLMEDFKKGLLQQMFI